ncbi:hypothetical protein T03_11293 [Trichinella britovi]|uniref:Uncharacterized protein n=1 Tax=Trichinella britovi TaxID=45882 RepID=A0A0V1C4C0_TRIBR|nr:hypothetical protein T03_11293 [Trichinella britovi]
MGQGPFPSVPARLGFYAVSRLHPDPVAKKGEQVSPKHTIVSQPLEHRPSRDIYLRIRFLHGFGSTYASSQCPPATLLPVCRRAPNRSVCMEVPAERITKLFRSALSRRIQQGTFVLRLLLCSPCRVGDTRSASVADALVPFQPSRAVLVTPSQASLKCPELAYGLLEVDRNVRLVPAEREAVFVPFSVEGQGILELFHHPCKFLVGIVYRVISIAWISQNLPNDASANSSIFIKRILVSAAGPIQSCNIFSATGSVASQLIRRVTKS